jgi:hypothetical protein
MLPASLDASPLEPPEELWEYPDDETEIPGVFVPAPQLRAFAFSFIVGGGALYNPDHDHLCDAHVAFLWTNIRQERQGRQIAGTAQLGKPPGNPWTAGKQAQQLREWFGSVPDFLITLDAPCFSLSEPATRLAILEHELYHCAMNGFNQQTGLPRWSMRPHDVEEFVGVVRRYGAEHGAGSTARLVGAALKEPQIAPAKIAKVCGTCL